MCSGANRIKSYRCHADVRSERNNKSVGYGKQCALAWLCIEMSIRLLCSRSQDGEVEKEMEVV